jgi:hypothetical protein
VPRQNNKEWLVYLERRWGSSPQLFACRLRPPKSEEPIARLPTGRGFVVFKHKTYLTRSVLSFSFVLFGVRLIHSFSSEFVLFTVSSESVSVSSESDSLLTGHFGVLWDLALCAVVQLFALQRLVALVSAYSSAL